MVDMQRYTIDEIEQQDAPVPGWWRIGFIGFLSICPLYLLYFHAGADGRSAVDRYEAKLEAITRKKYAEIGDLEPNADTILRFTKEDNWVKVGKVVFKSKCATCHGREAEGQIGPNLTDSFYKNVRKVEDIARVVLEGANNNAMPAWKDKMHPNDIVLVSAYVATLRGTDVEGGKGPEGSKIPEWSSETDSSNES